MCYQPAKFGDDMSGGFFVLSSWHTHTHAHARTFTRTHTQTHPYRAANRCTHSGDYDDVSNNQDNVYGADIMAKPLPESVHPVHLTNAEQRRTATNIWTKPVDLDR